MITRRSLLEAAGIGTLVAGSAAPRLFTAEAGTEVQLNLSPMLPEGTCMEAIPDTLPGKKPLIKLSYRPPNCETPIEYLGTDITPNDAFFVRYHRSDIPQSTPEPGSWPLAGMARLARSSSGWMI
jgi:hypothetical protein